MGDHRFQDIEVHFETAGKGPDAVLLHAGGSSGGQWRKTARFLEDRYRLVMPDFIGFGKTGNWPGAEEPSHDDQAALLASLIDAHCAPPVHIVGHSFGGAIAVRLVLARPDLLRRLVLIEPVLTPLLNLAGRQEVFAEYLQLANAFIDAAAAGQPERAWQGFIDYRNGEGTWSGLSDDARARFMKGTKQVSDTFKSNLDDPTTINDIRSIAAPVLVLCSELTTEPDRVVTEILHRELRDSIYNVIPGAEHMSPLTHPEPVASAIRTHLNGA